MRILFDGWFSQGYNFIEQIKEGYKKDVKDDNLFILGTHDKYMGWMELCDKFEIRNKFDQQLNNNEFCAGDVFSFYERIVEEYKIDVIFSKTLNSISCVGYRKDCNFINDKDRQYNIDTIDAFFKRINSLNCKIIRDSDSPLLNNKIATYEALCKYPSIRSIVPNYAECHNIRDVEEFYEPVQDKLVLKPEIGDGAKYIQIKRFPFNFEFDWYHYLIMNYLPNEEISIDCLQIEDEFLCIPRKKNKINRTQYVLYKDDYYEELRNYCKIIQDKFNLQMPFNVQFKLDNLSSHYLLEINPRLSAGSSMCYLLGVNFPWLTLKKLFNIPIFKTELDWIENACVSYYEKPILIEKGD